MRFYNYKQMKLYNIYIYISDMWLCFSTEIQNHSQMKLYYKCGEKYIKRWWTSIYKLESEVVTVHIIENNNNTH